MVAPPETVRAVVEALGRIRSAWREGRPRDMAELLDADVAMAFPEFTGRLEGRDALIASFEDFQKVARDGMGRLGVRSPGRAMVGDLADPAGARRAAGRRGFDRRKSQGGIMIR